MSKVMKKIIINCVIGFVLLLEVFVLSGCSVGPKYVRPGTMTDEANWSFLNRYYDTNDANGRSRLPATARGSGGPAPLRCRSLVPPPTANAAVTAEGQFSPTELSD